MPETKTISNVLHKVAPLAKHISECIDFPSKLTGDQAIHGVRVWIDPVEPDPAQKDASAAWRIAQWHCPCLACWEPVHLTALHLSALLSILATFQCCKWCSQ